VISVSLVNLNMVKHDVLIGTHPIAGVVPQGGEGHGNFRGKKCIRLSL